MGDALKKRNELRSSTVLFDHFEYWHVDKKPDAWQVHLDFHADVHLMAGCDGFVGKFSSNVGRIVLALMATRRRCLPPYISIDESRWCFDSSWPWVGRSAVGRFAC